MGFLIFSIFSGWLIVWNLSLPLARKVDLENFPPVEFVENVEFWFRFFAICDKFDGWLFVFDHASCSVRKA
jgi:hypothetical protein